MGAADIVEGLIKAGIALKGAVEAARGARPVDDERLLQTILADTTLGGMVEDVLDAIAGDDLEGAMNEIAAEQSALLDGRDPERLGGEELRRFTDLADARLLLATLAKAGLGAGAATSGKRGGASAFAMSTVARGRASGPFGA